MEVFELGAGAFQVSMVVKQVQSTEEGLRPVANERNDLLGTEKTMPADESDDLLVAFRQGNRRN